MVYEQGAVFGGIMLVTGLLSAWISRPVTEDGSFDSSPGLRTLLAFAGAILVTLVGAAILVLSLLE
ncbi:hypothetical protein BRC81_15620 [Halobacteriales archaeon QS_1_68_20]|nr:MAG: hypothetical protein BRC81_15620 [Halobacteriales archaeon QS_1_68_20]